VATEVQHLSASERGQSDNQRPDEKEGQTTVTNSFTVLMHTLLPWWSSRSTALMSFPAHPGRGGSHAAGH